MQNIDNFKKWLINQGAEILLNTNEYELLRFKGNETGIIYKSGKTSNEYTRTALKCFAGGKSWNGRPINHGRKTTYKKEKTKLLKRDGVNCFYCGEWLREDITIEHLISLSSGGKNILSNMVLSHEQCNQDAGNLTIIEKVKRAIKLRTKNK